ncbi:MAG: YfhO family protein [Oscillospiraceae bacterium]|nr:YfhO family protein [Oscillospiraceae bacterium]
MSNIPNSDSQKETVFVGELPEPAETASKTKFNTEMFKYSLEKSVNALSGFFNNYNHYILAFFIPAVILFIAYICFGVYPAMVIPEERSVFEEIYSAFILREDFNLAHGSVLSLDLNAQYIYYYDYIYDVLAGKESLFYSWSRNLSGEFMGIIGYYLASPFSFVVWLFPREFITEGVLTMLLTKVGAVGLSCCFYLYRGRHYKKSTSLIFSIMYALCAYVIVQTMNPMWLDGVIALPLIMYGVEQLIRRGRFRLLAVALVYAFVSCFYIGYMVGIFTGLYFCFYFWLSKSYERMDIMVVLSKIGLFAATTITALLSSSFMLIPVYNSLELGKFAFTEPDFSAAKNFILFDLFGKLLPNSYDTVRMEGLPFMYCGILTIIMVGCYFISKKIATRAKVANAFLLMSLAAFMFVRPLDMLWHGGQMPNWLPYRYSFMVSMVLIVMAAQCFDKIKNVTKGQIAATGAVIFGITLLLGKFDNYSDELERDLLPELTTIAIAAAIIAIITAFLVQSKSKLGNVKCETKGSRFGFMPIVLVVLVSSEMFYNTLTQLHKQDGDIVYSTRTSYAVPISYMREKMNEIHARDDGFFRSEKKFNRSANDPLALRMYGMTHSSSTLNDRPIALLEELGFTSRGHYTKYTGSTPLIDDLFGVKYILACPDDDYGRITGPEDITVEYNADAMPLAYLADPLFSEFYFSEHSPDKDNPFAKQNNFFSHMLGDRRPNQYFKTIPQNDLFLEAENVWESTASMHTIYTVSQAGHNAQLRYTVVAPSESEYFLWMPSDFERQLNVWVNDHIWKGNYYETEHYNIKSLGNFKRGEEFSVTLTLTTDNVYFKDVLIGYIDAPVYARDYTKLKEMNQNTVTEKISPTHLRVTTNHPEERLLFTSIPLEPGWKVTVNGRVEQPIMLVDALMGVMLEPGENVVELKYSVPNGALALILTAVGIMMFIMMSIVAKIIKKFYGEKDYELSPTHPDDGAPNEDIDEYSLNDARERLDEIYTDLMQINSVISPQGYEDTPAEAARQVKIIPYKEVSKPWSQGRLESYEASAEDLFPQKEVDTLIDKNKNKEG